MSTTTTKQISRRHRLWQLKDHPFVIPVITFLVLVFISLVALVSFNATALDPADSRVVHVYVDDEKQTLTTRASTVEDLLSRLEIKVHKGDIVEPALKTQILEDDFSVNVYRARQVTIVDGKKQVTNFSAKQSAEAIAREAGIKLYPEDNVQVSVQEDVINEGVGEKYIIERSIPVKLVLYGESYEIRTHSKTVSELLKEKEINQSEVTTFPEPESEIKANSVIFVTYEGRVITSKSETIPNKTERVNDPDLDFGVTEVREKGRKGKKLVLYEIDPATKKKKVLKTVIAYAPVNRVIAVGSKVGAGGISGSKLDWMRGAGIPSSQFPYVDLIIGRESGWRPDAVSANRCIGLGQRCAADVLISACPNWQTDPVCQLKHFDAYATGRYGSWQQANAFWQANHWW